jgi:hypothetical protein
MTLPLSERNSDRVLHNGEMVSRLVFGYFGLDRG